MEALRRFTFSNGEWPRESKGQHPISPEEQEDNFATSAVYFREGIYQRTGRALAQRREQRGWRGPATQRRPDGRWADAQCQAQGMNFYQIYAGEGVWLNGDNWGVKPRPIAQQRKQLEEALSTFGIIYTERYSALNLPHDDCNRFHTQVLMAMGPLIQARLAYANAVLFALQNGLEAYLHGDGEPS